MFCRLTHRNHTDVIVLLRVNDRHEIASERTKCHKSSLSVGNSVVFVGKRDAIENLIGIDKVETVLLEISLTLSLVPVDHESIVYTLRISVNLACSQGIFGIGRHLAVGHNVRVPPRSAKETVGCNQLLGGGLPSFSLRITLQDGDVS